MIWEIKSWNLWSVIPFFLLFMNRARGHPFPLVWPSIKTSVISEISQYNWCLLTTDRNPWIFFKITLPWQRTCDISGKTSTAINYLNFTNSFSLCAFQVIYVHWTYWSINQAAHHNWRLCLFMSELYSRQFYIYCNMLMFHNTFQRCTENQCVSTISLTWSQKVHSKIWLQVSW